MPYEFNRDQFICNQINPDKNIHNNYDNLQKNCELKGKYDESRRAELNYVDATNVQQRTWLHIGNLILGTAVLVYGIQKTM
jgi:hypothetical protein